MGKLITSTFVYTKYKNGYGITTKNESHDTYALFASIVRAFEETIYNIVNIDNRAYLHEALLTVFNHAYLVPGINRDSVQKKINREQEKLAKLKYFELYPDERDKINTLLKQIAAKKAEIAKLPELAMLKEMEDKKEKLGDRIYKLGIFDNKERKVLQEELYNLQDQIQLEREKIEAPIKELENKIKEIEDKIEKQANEENKK